MYVVLFARGTQEEVDAQLRLLREMARQQRWTLVGEYCDVLSGLRNDRRGFVQMLKDIQTGGIQAVVVTRRERLGFSPRLLVNLADDLYNRGVEILSVTEGCDMGPPMRKCLYGFIDLVRFIRDLSRW